MTFRSRFYPELMMVVTVSLPSHLCLELHMYVTDRTGCTDQVLTVLQIQQEHIHSYAQCFLQMKGRPSFSTAMLIFTPALFYFTVCAKAFQLCVRDHI